MVGFELIFLVFEFSVQWGQNIEHMTICGFFPNKGFCINACNIFTLDRSSKPEKQYIVPAVQI